MSEPKLSEPSLVLKEDRLSVKQLFGAPIERLFEYFTQPELLNQWHAPSDTMTIPVTEVDLKVGGRYRITMRNADGEEFTAAGSYQEIDKPNKLAYTWSWQHAEGPETLVTVLFTAQGNNSTEVELIHTGFAEAGVAEHHSQGWTGIFVRLGNFLNLVIK